MKGLGREHAQFVDPRISRDFLYVDDACEAFMDAAINLPESCYGESFNVGSGVKTTIGDFADLCKDMFELPGDPAFTMPNRGWDVPDWYANPAKARDNVGWVAKTSLREGMERMAAWVKSIEHPERYVQSSKTFRPRRDLERVGDYRLL